MGRNKGRSLRNDSKTVVSSCIKWCSRLLKEAENKTTPFFFKDFWRINLMQQKKRENNSVIKETMSNYEVLSWHDRHYHSKQQAIFSLYEHCFLLLFSFVFLFVFWWTHLQDLIIRQDFIWILFCCRFCGWGEKSTSKDDGQKFALIQGTDIYSKFKNV